VNSRRPRRYVFFGFATTHDSLAGEEALKGAGIPVTPVPTPSFLTGTLCGIALRTEPSDSDRARAVFERRGIEVQAEAEIADI